MSVDRSKWPVLVKLGLWGVPSRTAAWIFVWVSAAAAIGCIAYGFVNPIGFAGVLLLFAALWYYRAIRWVDQHGQWQ